MLTNEAKIHFATKVDNWTFTPANEVKTSRPLTLVNPDRLFKKDNFTYLEKYNPDSIDSPLRYLRDLVEALTEDQREEFDIVTLPYSEQENWEGHIPFAFSNPDIICKHIAEVTGYTGKVFVEDEG